MNAEPSHAKSIFLAAVELESAQEREAFIAAQCAGDADLRREVESLLRHHSKVGEFLEAPADIGDATIDPIAGERAGTVIGPYKLLEQIGEGGMGTVWMAEQTEPVRRKVALKLIKPGMDSKQVLARFEAERQALALMDHPNIAKVLDAGQSPPMAMGGLGRPYFVMELVKGVAITTFCDERRLTPKERLELFVPICQAIQHAHQKGIIHRDLKPSNVQVALYDGKPVPKVIDFGIAKAVGQQLTERTLFTGFGGIVGTPEYMSPEQAELNQLDIDTRSDIYSLGILLYELLTGTTPLTQKRLKEAALLEVLRIIREEEPPKPSTRLSTTDELPSIAAKRNLEPKKLSGLVRGELDWIVMKCLDKDRNRRYETANGLAVDLQRYLHDEPVSAGPPSAWYRMKKFVRRNRAAVMGSALLLTALAAGTAGTTIGMIRARNAEAEAKADRDKANAAAEEERKSKELAQKRLNQLEKANSMLSSIFLRLNPQMEAAGGPSLREQMGQGLLEAGRELDAQAVGDPVMMAKLQNDLGEALRLLSFTDSALDLFIKARRNLETEREADSPDLLLAANNEALAYADLGQWTKAIALFEDVHRRCRERIGADAALTLTVQCNLARAYLRTQQAARAIPLLEQAAERRKIQLSSDDPELLRTLNDLAEALTATNRFARALPILQQILDQQRGKLGPDHFDTLSTACNLAAAHRTAGNHEESLRIYDDVLSRAREKLGNDHVFTLTVMNNVASGCWQLWKLDRSIPLLEETVSRMKVKIGADHPTTLQAMANLSANYRDAGRVNEAIPIMEVALARSRKLPRPLPGEISMFPMYLAMAYEQAQEAAKAEPLFRETLEFARSNFDSPHPLTAYALVGLGWSLMEQKRFAEAEPPLREGLEIREKIQPNLWLTFDTMTLLGACLAAQDKLADAEALLVRGGDGLLQRIAQFRAAEKPRAAAAIQRVVAFYENSARKEKADEWRAKMPK